MNRFAEAYKTLTLKNGSEIRYYSLETVEKEVGVQLTRLPYSLRVLLESILRNQGHPAFQEEHIVHFARWSPQAQETEEFPFMPARVLLQDFTGVPCVVDLAALRDVMARSGRDPKAIEPQIPVDLVIDHSVQIDRYASVDSLKANMDLEFSRNAERYAFLRWGQGAFKKLRIVPPGLGICHQVNLEYLAQCVISEKDANGQWTAYPDTLVGTDSHTTMINGLGILGWGVGGIEAEAAMLGQPIPLLTPTVTGVRLLGQLTPGVTATDLALTITQRLREKGVVGQFVEFFGPGLSRLSLADRATVANMAPEYGATSGFFPIDDETLRYLRQTGRSEEQIDLVERYCKAQGLFRTASSPDPVYNSVLELDLSAIEPVIAGPKRPHDRLTLSAMKPAFQKALTAPVKERGYGLTTEDLDARVSVAGQEDLRHGSVVIASITSCTNTSNPHVLLAAGLVARNAIEKGLKVPGYVKTSLAPGSRVVTAYLKKSGLLTSLQQLGFHVDAYGCATCIGNSGPLDANLEASLKNSKLVVSAVLSGNRNFEGRVHPMTKANFLCSPPLVVAYALAGTTNIDLTTEPIGRDAQGQPVYLKDLWPSETEIQAFIEKAVDPEIYRKLYNDVAASNPAWNAIAVDARPVYAWEPSSTYIRNPSFVSEIQPKASPVRDILSARALGLFGDFITTDHISPAGSIPKDSPAGQYLIAHGVQPKDFNSYGSRRGNHEVMLRGTFANVRIRNRMVEREGGWTVHVPSGDLLPIYDAAERYRAENTPLIVLAGKMYGAGSSRDWAAKGTYLLGVRAVIAESFERIHRSNLVEMGILPLELTDGQTADSLGLTGKETFTVQGIEGALTPSQVLTVVARDGDRTVRFQAKSRIDSAIEVEYVRNGGILAYVLRDMMNS
ncbi:MAG TPA: aconitate hydratase AcnA [Verrucomicrobia bacterium]|nr:MAG: aconitate hydratase 1 [Lentisphaerae bacterium GWF2_57_35]HBA86118.1 aconitate hydratase AcnA [Verrucomicrobiota bacterium]